MQHVCHMVSPRKKENALCIDVVKKMQRIAFAQSKRCTQPPWSCFTVCNSQLKKKQKKNSERQKIKGVALLLSLKFTIWIALPLKKN